uniref:Putative secreted protein n=1 Tax=Ixodes scapularis TaxID=6945 RepID=A0A4D5RCS2_IXOSC
MFFRSAFHPASRGLSHCLLQLRVLFCATLFVGLDGKCLVCFATGEGNGRKGQGEKNQEGKRKKVVSEPLSAFSFLSVSVFTATEAPRVHMSRRT